MEDQSRTTCDTKVESGQANALEGVAMTISMEDYVRLIVQREVTKVKSESEGRRNSQEGCVVDGSLASLGSSNSVGCPPRQKRKLHCKHCNKEYMRAGRLRMHIESKHSECGNVPASSTATTASTSTVVLERPAEAEAEEVDGVKDEDVQSPPLKRRKAGEEMAAIKSESSTVSGDDQTVWVGAGGKYAENGAAFNKYFKETGQVLLKTKDEGIVWTNRKLLKGFSPVVRTLIEKEESKGSYAIPIKLDHVNQEPLQVIFQWMQDFEIKIEDKEKFPFAEFVKAAKYYQFLGLLNYLEAKMIDCCNKDNIGELLGVAQNNDMKDVIEKILSKILKS